MRSLAAAATPSASPHRPNPTTILTRKETGQHLTCTILMRTMLSNKNLDCSTMCSWVRFAHAIPAPNEVDAVVTLGNETKTWSQYKFGRFSDWAGHFNATNGNGQIEIYENVNGKRGSLLAKATRFLPPGPVLIAIKGDWPPTSDSSNALGSIEAIANSFTKPANGSAEVRLFNLGPDTPKASMSANGKVTATDVAFTLGSTWSPLPASMTSFKITDTTSGNSLASFAQTPPVGASSVFLIGTQNASAAAGLKTQSVFLVDNPT